VLLSLPASPSPPPACLLTALPTGIPHSATPKPVGSSFLPSFLPSSLFPSPSFSGHVCVCMPVTVLHAHVRGWVCMCACV
jgi:hypothetical protein